MQSLLCGRRASAWRSPAVRRPLFARSRARATLQRESAPWRGDLMHRTRLVKNTTVEDLTAKWQPHWDNLAPEWHNLRATDTGKAFVLPMFPYPSGTLHLGHLRVYTISDVLARFKHMQGYEVLHPIGWDAFGLPAENAAIERGVHPEKWTMQNIEAMKSQMKEMGGHWNWDSELRTCDPDFYKYTQRIFLMLFERGLAYQAESLVNYDPVDRTVLANEQVDANGCSWRSGAKVEKVMLKQWFLKIKEFQDALLDDLEYLAEDGKWPEKVLAMQKNWIGKSVGTKLWFDIHATRFTSVSPQQIDVFTTRADTLFGVQYIALSCQHPIVQELAKSDSALQVFIERAGTLPPDAKDGYQLQDITAKNPLAALMEGYDTPIPVYVAPYVLDGYGSGAVMGVPGHDARDHAFWRQNAGDQAIKKVVSASQEVSVSVQAEQEVDSPFTERGFVAADIPDFGGLASSDAALAIVKKLQESGQRAETTTTFRLRDWLISRQRYWGTPIPIIHCDSCGPVPVPSKDLPVELPNLPDSFFDGRKGNPLAEDETWKKTTCPKCGGEAERETDTMDTFMDSSWYFFRFLDPKNPHNLITPQKAEDGMPVDLYIGGVEHAILHLLYARFISKFLASTDVWPAGKHVHGEPFKRLITQGMVHGETFSDPSNGRFLRPDEVDLSTRSAPVIKATGVTPTTSFEKMSKSKYNGVDPGATIAKYGADATRAHMLFQAPVGDVLNWDEQKITGVQRWLHRVIRLAGAFWLPDLELKLFFVPRALDLPLDDIQHDRIHRHHPQLQRKPPKKMTSEKIPALHPAEAHLWTTLQSTITSVTASMSTTYALNTTISDLMTLTNTIWSTPHASSLTSTLKWHATAALLRMLAPIAPGVAEEGWHLLVHGTRNERHDSVSWLHDLPSVFATGWPVADSVRLVGEGGWTKCVVQVDGKRKTEVDLRISLKKTAGLDPMDAKAERARDVLEALAGTPEGAEWLDEKNGKVWRIHAEIFGEELGGHEGDQKAGIEREVHPLYGIVPRKWRVVIVEKPDARVLCNLVSPRLKKKNIDKGELEDVKAESENETE